MNESAMGSVPAPAPTTYTRWRSVGRRLMSPTILAPIGFGIAVGLIWQAGVFHSLFNIKTFTVPYPSAIADAVGKNGPTLLEATQVTLTAALLGWTSGMAFGVLVASLLVRYKPGAVQYALPLLSATNSVPIVALAPLLALWIDPGLGLKVVVVTIMTLPTMVAYSVRGLTNVEPTTVELMESIEASPNQLYRMVRLPTALPFMFTGMKSAVVLALIGTIVVEAIRGFEGLGYVIQDSLSRFDAPKAWLALLTIAAIGITWYVVIDVLERLALPWEIASRRRT